MTFLRRYLRLFGLFARVSMQDDAAYRLDFLAHILVGLVHVCGEIVAIWTIFSNTDSLGGWGQWQVLGLFGVFRIMVGLIGMIVGPNMRLMMEEIRTGKLDYVLLKPVNSQFYCSTRRIVVWRGVDMILGSILITVAVSQASGHVSALNVLLFLLMLAAGMTIVYSLWLVLATCAFWLTRVSNIEMVFWNLFEAGRYPVNIYSTPMRLALTYILPLAFLTTIPAGALMNRVSGVEMLTAVIFAPLALLGASLFWRHGVRSYSGASA